MYKRQPLYPALISGLWTVTGVGNFQAVRVVQMLLALLNTCLLYTSDAADERSSVDLGGRRIIKKKKRP